MKTRAARNVWLILGTIISVTFGGFSTNAQTLAEALDTTNLVWTTGGDTVWFAETTNTYDGVDAVQSGIVQSNQTSWLETTVVGPATVSFWSFTQSSAGSFSWRFTINDPGPPYGRIASSFFPNWSQQVYDLGDGTNVLRWTAIGAATGSESGFVCLDEFTVSPPRPLAIVVQPMDTTVYSGAPASLAISAVGTPPLQYQWLKDGTNLSNATNFWLSFSETTTNNTGVYSVIVSNSQDSIASSNALLTVLPPSPPFFTSEPESTTVYTGQYFQWRAVVDGSPPSQAIWQKDGTNFFEETFAGPWGYNLSLTFTNVSLADAGSYRLWVTNDYGDVESSNAVLTVLPSVAPVITRQPRSLEVAAGANTWITLSATGVPGPYYVWTKAGTPPPVSPPGLPPPPQVLNPNPQRVFNNVTTNDAGIYFATVTNYAGSVASQDALLTVLPAITNVGSSSEDAEGIFVTNDLAYLARGTNGLAILDVSDPASPQWLGSCDTPDYASAVRVSDGLAFVADGAAGLQVISVTNPSNPVIVGNYATPGYANDLAVRSNLVYLADRHGGLLIVSVSNPASPALIGSYLTNLSPDHICLSGNLAYLTSLTPTQILGGPTNNWVGGMLVVDVSDPAHPAEVVRWGGSLGNVAARGPILFTGSQVISLTNPALPVIIGSMNFSITNLAAISSPINVRVVNDLAYLLASMNGQVYLVVFNVRDPAEPIPVGYYTDGGQFSTLAVDDNEVYLSGYESPLEIVETPFDTSPVTAPVLSVSVQAGINLDIQGRRGLHYNVEYTDQLSGDQWQTLQTILLTNDNAVIQVPSGPATRFFRLIQLD